MCLRTLCSLYSLISAFNVVKETMCDAHIHLSAICCVYCYVLKSMWIKTRRWIRLNGDIYWAREWKGENIEYCFCLCIGIFFAQILHGQFFLIILHAQHCMHSRLSRCQSTKHQKGKSYTNTNASTKATNHASIDRIHIQLNSIVKFIASLYFTTVERFTRFIAFNIGTFLTCYRF